MADYVSIKQILQKVASFDTNGASEKEIDTKEEYKSLGSFLNGEDISGGGIFRKYYNYVDLSKEDKKLLFDKMKSLEEKFGPWENKFEPSKSLNLNTANVYLDRYRAYQDKLANFENEEDKVTYYNDIKDELVQIETKLNEFCKKYNIETELTSQNIGKISDKLYYLEKDFETQEFLKNYSENFKLTLDNHTGYMNLLEDITDDFYKPIIISPEDNTKVVDILKKACIEFLQPGCDEELNDDNILEHVRYDADALNKIETMQIENTIKNFLNSDNISKQNIDNLCVMSSYFEYYQPAGTLSDEEYEQAKTKLKNIWDNYANQYLTEGQKAHLTDYGFRGKISARIRNENNGTYKKYEAKIAEILHYGDNFKITNDNAQDFTAIFGYLQEKKLDSSSLTDAEFLEADKILTNAYFEYLKQFVYTYDKEPLSLDNIKTFHIGNCVLFAKESYKILNNLKKCGDIIQQWIDKPFDNSILKDKVEQYIKDNNIPEINKTPKHVDIGNGKFDKTSTQHNENCWAHAGINSLLTTEEGKLLIENNYYRDEKTGVAAVHIPEADNYGIHEGIFYVTPQEIINSQETVASGEGDITAYIIAFQKYFDELTSNPELNEKYGEERLFTEMDEGNYGFRVYELMTGGEHTDFNHAYNIKDEDQISKGIGVNTDFDVQTLYRMIEQKEGVMTISLRGMGHNISVVGVKDGKFLIQESNNYEHVFDGELKEGDVRIFSVEKKVNNRPTFGITIEDLDKYGALLGAINYMKFK